MPPEPKSLIITGASGMLGSAVAELARTLWLGPVSSLSRGEGDILDLEIGRRLDGFAGNQPAVVVNCAAYTDVNGAESNYETALAVNGQGPANLARTCAQRQWRLLHVSTDYVFDGTARQPYPESHPVNPVNAYGRSKLAGEQAILEIHPHGSAIVRTSWLYGPNGKCFPATILAAARQGKPLRVVADQSGSPTFTRHLASVLLQLAQMENAPETTGLFHGTNSGFTTWHGFAVKVLQAASIDVTVEPVSTEAFPTPAKRPAYSVLANNRLPAAGIPPLPDWCCGVTQYLGNAH